VTGTLPNPLTADYVKLPYKNPPGRHPKTGLTKEAAVLRTWIVTAAPNDIRGRSGFVPPAHMAIVNAKTAARGQDNRRMAVKAPSRFPQPIDVPLPNERP